MSQPIEITLLRHGRSLADDEKRCEGRYDSPLTEAGVEQTKRRLAHWQEKKVAHLTPLYLACFNER
jgi:2,3-bisphosphoglycerate-dependent phosphoglycerate mutase